MGRGFYMSQLQEIIGEFGCTVLNYTGNKIEVDHFCSEDRYKDYLAGINCRAGMGLFDVDEVLVFNRLGDNILVVIQADGIETSRYRYIPIFKATMEYKDKNTEGKKVNKTLTFKIRRNEFSSFLNFVDTDNNSLDFYNIQEIKDYLKEKFGTNQLTDWSVYIGKNAVN